MDDKRVLVQQLGTDSSSDATDLLIAASLDRSGLVAIDAVQRLSQRIDDRVAEHLIALLNSREMNVRLLAARALGDANWRAALPALEARLEREKRPVVVRQLRQTIRRLGGEAGPGRRGRGSPVPGAEGQSGP